MLSGAPGLPGRPHAFGESSFEGLRRAVVGEGLVDRRDRIAGRQGRDRGRAFAFEVQLAELPFADHPPHALGEGSVVQSRAAVSGLLGDVFARGAGELLERRAVEARAAEYFSRVLTTYAGHA